ncbi:MAG: hypothetical protein ABI679_03050 [Gemmatimonadota bacterium]
MTQTAVANRKTATILHLALTLGPVLFIGVAAYLRLRPGATPPPGMSHPEILQYVAYLVAVSGFGMALMLRSRLEPNESGQDEAAWWTINQPKMIVIWALIEGPMLLAGIVFLLQGSLPVVVAVGGCGFLLMLLTAPSRLSR